jgi:hypothetical protein
LQIASAARVDELLALGCGDRRLLKLAEQIEPLLSDPEMMAYIDKERQEQLWASAPRLHAMCAELDRYHIPATLVHGDMHMSNVARRGDSYLFFDWTDACIAHPFLDMIDVVHERDAAVQTRLRDSYLKEWLAYEPMEMRFASATFTGWAQRWFKSVRLVFPAPTRRGVLGGRTGPS